MNLRYHFFPYSPPVAILAAPFATRYPNPLPIAVTTGLLEPTSTLAFKYRLGIGKPFVCIYVLYGGVVWVGPYRVTSKDAAGLGGSFYGLNHLYHLPMTVTVGQGWWYQFSQER